MTRVFVLFMTTASWLTGWSSGLAHAYPGDDDDVPQAILNLDLCTLAYQLYHQSLSLPLDPWYDQFSRVGSDRRDNICRYTRDYIKKLSSRSAASDPAGRKNLYGGPNEARGWADGNQDLDPILTNYIQLDPKQPSLMWDGSAYIATLAPAYLTDSLRDVTGVRYRSKPTEYPSDNTERFSIRSYPSGEDHLMVFEGGTGVMGDSDPSWSLIGFVLMRKTSKGYDAHIVFRGSRGGSVGRTVFQAQGLIGKPKGNPDWVTDLAFGKQVKNATISQVGSVTQGFAMALPTMLGPIKACCERLSKDYPPPQNIYVTGHSLGAALASQFASAVQLGSYGDGLRRDLDTWPWDSTRLFAYAQPIPGDPTWALQFNDRSPLSEHYWVEGDVVVESTSSILRRVLDKGVQCGKQRKLSMPSDCSDDPHEVFVIRTALLRELSGQTRSLSSKLTNVSSWGYYDNIAKMVAGEPKNYVAPGASVPHMVTAQNLRTILARGNVGDEFTGWLAGVYANMIADKSSYRGPSFGSTMVERRNTVDLVVQQMKRIPPRDKRQALDSLVNDFELVTDKLGTESEEQWIKKGMILNTFQKSNLTFEDLLSNPAIKQCLEAE